MNRSIEPARTEGHSGAAIIARDLTKQFRRDVLALDRVSFSVAQGQIHCLLGGPGSGKTTAADLIAGLAMPSAGSVSLLGTDPALEPLRARASLTFVHGPAALYSSMSAVENLLFFASLSRPPVRLKRTSAANALRKMGVPDRHLEQDLGWAPRRVGLAVSLALALVRETPILVLDDPTSGIDSKGTADVLDILDDFRTRGVAVLLTSSDLFVAAQVADWIGILKAGQLVDTRSRRQFLKQSVIELYAEYVGRLAPDALGFAATSHRR